MSLYNTVPDLESEEQPLVAAPRKLGKTLVVVALFGFAAGAAAATAAPHVAAKMNLVAAAGDEVGMDYDTSGRLTNDGYNGPSIDIDGDTASDTPAAKMSAPGTQSVGAGGGDDATPGASKAIETTQTGPYIPGRK